MSSAAINIIRPLNNKNIILNYETSKQDFNKNHEVKKDSVLAGTSFKGKNNINSFILAGVSRHNSKRNILTNTT